MGADDYIQAVRYLSAGSIPAGIIQFSEALERDDLKLVSSNTEIKVEHDGVYHIVFAGSPIGQIEGSQFPVPLFEIRKNGESIPGAIGIFSAFSIVKLDDGDKISVAFIGTGSITFMEPPPGFETLFQTTPAANLLMFRLSD